MTEEQRAVRLRDAASAVADVEVGASRVLAALNETFEALPGPLAVPNDPRARAAVALELEAARAELIAAAGALRALETRERQLMEPLGPFPDPRAFAGHHVEFTALSNEGSRQRDRIAVLEAVVRDLEDALGRSGATPG